MMGQTGAMVLLNASSGEILVLVSAPSFDPNQLDTTWENLLSDPRAPLLNRATQGAYPPGAILGPLLLAQTASQSGLPVLSAPETFSGGETTLTCAFPPPNSTWAAAIQAGCPAPVAVLAERLKAEQLLMLLTGLKLYSPPAIRLPASSTSAPTQVEDPVQTALGQDLTISPLQMALAAATLSNKGILPAPRLALAYSSSDTDWTLLPPLGGSENVFPEIATQQTASALASSGMPVWESLSLITMQDENITDVLSQAFTWYVGGTLPDWAGAPVVAVVLLEDGHVDLAREIGQGMLKFIVNGE
jgi:cell division protein FtsI/penicillin-binding protein 2